MLTVNSKIGVGRQSSQKKDIPSWLVIIPTVILFASFLTPQLSYWGRGLRLSLPLYCFLILYISVKNKKEFIGILAKQAKFLFWGIVFIVFGVLRYSLQPNTIYLNNFLLSSIVILFDWIIIILLQTQSNKTIEYIQWITLLTIGVSFGLGLSILYNQPEVARLTMGNILEEKYISIYFPQGVANYSLYTAFAIAVPVIANWLINRTPNHRSFLKFIGWIMLLVLTVSVILSSFVGATLLLLIGILILLFILFFKGRRKRSLVAALLLILLAIFSPQIYRIGVTSSSTIFVTNKATRIITNITNVGFVEGDDTGRAHMLVNDLKKFSVHPFLGAWGVDNRIDIGGHSSWGDYLVLFGLPGLVIWLIFLSTSFLRGKRPFSIVEGTAGGTISWVLVAIGGILNPTLNISVIFLMIWIFDDFKHDGNLNISNNNKSPKPDWKGL